MLLDLFGILKIGILGGVISTISIFSCAWNKSLFLYFINYSLIFSIGQAMQIIASLGITTHYFKKVFISSYKIKKLIYFNN